MRVLLTVLVMTSLALAPGCDSEADDGGDVVPETHPALDGKAARLVIGETAYTDDEVGFFTNLGGGVSLLLGGATASADRFSILRLPATTPNTYTTAAGTQLSLTMRLGGVELTSAMCEVHPDVYTPVETGVVIVGQNEGFVWGHLMGAVCADPTAGEPLEQALDGALFSARDAD